MTARLSLGWEGSRFAVSFAAGAGMGEAVGKVAEVAQTSDRRTGCRSHQPKPLSGAALARNRTLGEFSYVGKSSALDRPVRDLLVAQNEMEREGSDLAGQFFAAGAECARLFTGCSTGTSPAGAGAFGLIAETQDVRRL